MKRSGPPKRKTPLRAKKGLERGEPLKSKSELKRKTPLEGGSELARTELAPRSDKRKQLMADERVPTIKAMQAEGRRCEIGPTLIHYAMIAPSECHGRIEGLHELRKRSAGGSLVNPDNLIPSCNRCNGWVEDNPEDAYVLGFVVREGDDDWEALGRRNDINLTEPSP